MTKGRMTLRTSNRKFQTRATSSESSKTWILRSNLKRGVAVPLPQTSLINRC